MVSIGTPTSLIKLTMRRVICVILPLDDDIIIGPSILVDSVNVEVDEDKAKVKIFLFNVGQKLMLRRIWDETKRRYNNKKTDFQYYFIGICISQILSVHAFLSH